MYKNLYEVLGVKPAATVEEIKHAYRRQAMKWHPDRHTSDRAEAEERFKEIAYAYSILSDPFKRQEYDQSVSAQEGGAAGAEFTDEMAFDAFLAAILDMAFELASRGHSEIQIYRLLVAGGCPEKVAETISHRAYMMTGQHASNAGNGAAGVNKSPPTPPTKNPNNAGHFPWVRYFARSVDMTLFAMLGFLAVGWLKPELLAQQGVEWFLLVPILFVWTFVEAWFLSALGNTPGKWLLNIKVSLASGKPIAFHKVLLRSLKVWWRGLGTGFPLISVITMLVAYFRLVKQGATSWDEEGGYVVTHGKVGGFQWAVAIALLVVPLVVPVLFEKGFMGSGVQPTVEITQSNAHATPATSTSNPATPEYGRQLGDINYSLLSRVPTTIYEDVSIKAGMPITVRKDIVDAQQVLRGNPHDANAWVRLGAAFTSHTFYTDGIEAYQQALRINPQDANAWNNLGANYEWSGQRSKAIEAFQQALRINPTDSCATYNLKSAAKSDPTDSRARYIQKLCIHQVP